MEIAKYYKIKKKIFRLFTSIVQEMKWSTFPLVVILILRDMSGRKMFVGMSVAVKDLSGVRNGVVMMSLKCCRS